MQAILTKYLGATDYRPSRVKAWCQAGSVTVSWNHDVDVEANHAQAVQALLTKLGWGLIKDWQSGGLPNGSGNAYVHRTY